VVAGLAAGRAWEGGRQALGDVVWSQALGQEAAADLGHGEYQFFPHRKSVWVVNRTNGRMANYNFRDEELGNIERSRIAAIDLRAFPRQDTLICQSDRNLFNVLWVCNTRTGDVQMWQVARDGSLRPSGPIATSTDLIERQPAAPR
jgi:hypothetical protein